jgi:hypothetical protein
MRTVISALVIALLAVTAVAQSNSSLETTRDQRSGYRSHKVMKPRYVKDMDEESRERSYRDALRSIPDSKIDHDPWRDAR